MELDLDGLEPAPPQAHSGWGGPGTDPAHMVSNNSPKPPVLSRLISRIGVNFLIYYCLWLSFPPLYPISLYLEETPGTKNQPPEAKTKPGSPSASLLLPGESSLKKKKIPSGLLFIQRTEFSRKMEIFYAQKLLMKQKAAGSWCFMLPYLY